MKKNLFRGNVSEDFVKDMEEFAGEDVFDAPHWQDILAKNGWVYGSLSDSEHSPYIVGEVVDWGEEYIETEYWVAVGADTIGQYIGRKDKNDTLIFTGDILQGMGVVVWIPDETRFGVEISGELNEVTFGELEQKDLNVIGNIYSNPEYAEYAEIV